MIAFKKYMVAIQEYYSQTTIVECMKVKLKVPMKILATIKKCLVIIQLSQNIKIIQTK